MLKNRKIEMKIVNTKKNPTEVDPNEITFETKAAIMSAYAHNAIHQIGKAVIAYVAIDTIRKVMIEHAKK